MKDFVSQEVLRKLGNEVGFISIGATDASPFLEMQARLEYYDERGRTGYEHPDTDLRVHPQKWLPWAKSLIVVAMPYLTQEGHQLSRRHPKEGAHGVVTVYSYGQDYHHVMTKRLQALSDKLSEYVGHPIQSHIAVDTSPLVDRRVAERANVGWIGKNCLFYTKEHGSFVFLGTLVADVDVELPKEETEPKCGDCDLCMRACPTGALIAPGVIDATRCLSYITQMKGMIPRAYRKPMGRRVWGCDTCQWACPENRNVAYSEHEEYLPTGELAFPELISLLSLSNRAFQKQYGHTAAAWRGVRTFQRNALIALGNMRHQEAIPHILPFLQHERSELRASAAWALGEIGGSEAVESLRQMINVEKDQEVLAEVQVALTQVGGLST